MEQVGSAAFRDALASRRTSFNAAVRRAQSAGAKIDGRALLRHLAGDVNSAVEAVATCAPDRVGVVVDALLAASIDTFALGLAGETGLRPAVAAAWSRLRRFPLALAADAGAVVRDLVHGALRIDAEIPGRAVGWMVDMEQLGGSFTTPDALRALGVVCAWRSGLAYARDAALLAWRTLPDDVACAVFDVAGVEAPGRARIERDLAFRWRVPGAGGAPRLTLAGRVGNSVFLGGSFARPPSVHASGERLFVTDGGRWWRLHADACGALLRPSSAPSDPPSNAASFRIERDGTVVHEGLVAAFEVLAEPSSIAATADTLAVTTRRSHRVRLVAAVTVPS